MNNGRLNNLPGAKRTWAATGEATTMAATVAPPAATLPATTPAGSCSSCTKKKIACVLAGLVIGIVGTLMFKKGAKAA